jgi:outer membrane protein
MKRIVMAGGFALVLALVATAVPAVAQQGAQPAAASKVAYVNTREILRQTPGYAQAESLYNKEFDAYQVEVQRLRSTLDSAAGDFERRSAMLNATQRKTEQLALQDKGKKAEQRVQELQQKMGQRERELLEPIQSRINSVIEGMRAAGGYAIIFDVSAPNSPIVTADRALDMTDKVIQQLK